jgi:hypothetical protein
MVMPTSAVDLGTENAVRFMHVPILTACQRFARGLSCNTNLEGKFVTGKDGKKRPRRPRGTQPPGRPPRYPGERLSKNRTFRVRGGLDEKLQAAAAASGRSVSEEIEFRLDQSFDRDAFIGPVLGGDENAKVLQSIATVMKLESHNGHWLKDVKTSDTVRRAVNFVIGQFAEPYQPPPFFTMMQANPIMERAKVLPSDATPEALADQALQTVRRLGWIHISNKDDKTPGGDGEAT